MKGILLLLININNQENIMKNREKKILNEENNKTNSFVNGMANDKNQDFIIKENKNRIRYRKKIINHLKINISLMEMKIKVIQC